MNIVPQLYPEAEHGLSVGQNGMGKTTTNIRLIRAASSSYPTLIVDAKGERKFAEFGPMERDPTKLHLDRTEWYHPREDLATPKLIDHVLNEVYHSGTSLYLYIDEVTAVAPSPFPGPGLENILSRGRDRTVGGRQVCVSCLMSTQAPVSIPGKCFRESKHFYIHRVLTRRDRKTISEHLGEQFLTTPIPKHHFWYFQPASMERPVLIRLDLSHEGVA